MDTLLAAKKVLEEINDSNFLACTFEKIGSVLFDKKNYTGSMESFDSAKVVFEKCRNKRGLADTYINMAWIYLQQKKYDDAASYATTGLNLANELSCIAAITNAKKCLARIQKLNRN
jgi:tetratricopeptide (TPR) repeat protein